MFFNKFFGGNNTPTENNNTPTNNSTTTNVNNNNNNNNIDNNNGESRFSSFGFNKITVSTDTFKKFGSSVQSFASNVYQKIEEETKKLVEEGPNTYSDCAMMPPWMDFQLEDKVKQAEIREKLLDVKMSRSTFLQSPPIDADYFQEFDDHLVKIATVSLKYDPILQKIRFHFVPKLISEEQFWKNWYYRITLVKKQYNITSSTNDIKLNNKGTNDNNSDNNNGNNNNNDKKDTIKTSPSQEETDIGKWEKELQSELDNFDINDIVDEGNIDFSLNNDLLNDDDDGEDWESKINLELQQNNQKQTPKQQSLASTTFSSPMISASFSSPVTDSDVDLEIEKELLRMSQSNIIDKSTTDELIEEIESEIQLAQKDGLILNNILDENYSSNNNNNNNNDDDNDDDDDNNNNNNNNNNNDNDNNDVINDDINNCSNIEINNSSIEINNDYDYDNNNNNNSNNSSTTSNSNQNHNNSNNNNQVKIINNNGGDINDDNDSSDIISGLEEE
ncbi:hypothetical protein RB653_001188 [Dictyostelium firmibasis]|uniref:BSD domain-containing protein n=1 Tax=Dictyostelium firmibasis TaxID=79012 RepID=A0AAN7TWJ7_9MYCE